MWERACGSAHDGQSRAARPRTPTTMRLRDAASVPTTSASNASSTSCQNDFVELVAIAMVLRAQSAHKRTRTRERERVSE